MLSDPGNIKGKLMEKEDSQNDMLFGKPEYVAYAWCERVLFVNSEDLKKCLKQIKLPFSLYTCFWVTI